MHKVISVLRFSRSRSSDDGLVFFLAPLHSITGVFDKDELK